MKLHMLRIAALAAIAVVPAIALAQSESDAFFKSADARGFYTDDTMKTMVAKEEMAAAFAKMTPDAQAKMKVACGATTDQSTSGMCEAAKAAN